jgi:uncharacterized protein YraI
VKKNDLGLHVAGKLQRLWQTLAILTLILALCTPANMSIAQSNQVFGLRGSLTPAVTQSFAMLFTDSEGNQYGMVGATPLIEAQLNALASQQATIKVWGQVRPPDDLSALPVIVVSELLLDAQPTPSPMPSPMSGATATISVYAAYVRAGPGQQYTPLGSVTQGVVCRVIGRSTMPGWWQLSCPTITGWIKEGLYTIQGDVSQIPLLSVAPVAAPKERWRAQGYANPDLAGSPTVTFDTATIAYDWGAGSPNPALPSNNFSLRFERTISFAPNLYRLEAIFDDGVRVYVGGQLVIDDWREGTARSAAWQGNLAGELPLRVDYVEYSGLAKLYFSYRQAPSSPAPTPAPLAQSPSGAWIATYYGNPTLSGPALLSRTEQRGDPYPLNYEFSLGSAVPGVVPEDNWSARWQGRFYFEAGDYRFQARGNDGVRVYLDGIRIIDAWPNTQDTVSNVFYGLGAGEHEVTVDFYDIGGLAWVRAWWERLLPDRGSSRDQ